jgi:hypothetical protein
MMLPWSIGWENSGLRFSDANEGSVDAAQLAGQRDSSGVFVFFPLSPPSGGLDRDERTCGMSMYVFLQKER